MSDNEITPMDDDEFMDWCDMEGIAPEHVMESMDELYARFLKDRAERIDGGAPLDVCELCGEPVRDGQGAEMFDPSAVKLAQAYYCHADCGLSRGMEVA